MSLVEKDSKKTKLFLFHSSPFSPASCFLPKIKGFVGNWRVFVAQGERCAGESQVKGLERFQRLKH